jgi:inner membrane protein involved in colicin E2 resistance
MHLRHERAVIYAIALVPLVFVVIFLIGLFPDFVYHPTKP